MIYSMVSDDTFLEFCILKEKAEAALGCIIGDLKCRHPQTLAEIAGDYLSAMDKMIDDMQENRIVAPAT